MSLPSRALIKGVWFRIKRAVLPKEHGTCDCDARIIQIDKDAPASLVMRIYFHERAHAVMRLSGLSEIVGAKAEEALCRAFEDEYEAIYLAGVRSARRRRIRGNQ